MVYVIKAFYKTLYQMYVNNAYSMACRVEKQHEVLSITEPTDRTGALMAKEVSHKMNGNPDFTNQRNQNAGKKVTLRRKSIVIAYNRRLLQVTQHS